MTHSSAIVTALHSLGTCKSGTFLRLSTLIQCGTENVGEIIYLSQPSGTQDSRLCYTLVGWWRLLCLLMTISVQV